LIAQSVQIDCVVEGAVVPAAQVHAAFMAALKFGYAKAISIEESLAKTVGRPH
jgi:hypothetical protein